jgi:glycosyltransferase involved in cell wall biosynthesis
MTQPLKILLIGNYIADGQQSMLHFSKSLTLFLKKQGYAITCLHPPKILGYLTTKQSFLSKWLGYIDKYILFPFILYYKKNFFDIYHICDHSNAPYLAYLKAKKTLVTCHDVLAIRSAKGDFKNNPIKTFGKYLQSYIGHYLKKAPYIAFVSQKTANDFEILFSKKPTHSIVIPNGLHYPYRPLNNQTANNIITKIAPSLKNIPYLLHVGNNNWYKNRAGILHLFKYLSIHYHQPLKCVFVGQPLTPTLKNIAENLNINKLIIEIGPLDNLSINAFYSQATALLFPSIQEGFGWPILEGLASGCPVVTTDAPPMNELGHTFSTYLPPYNPNDDSLDNWVSISGPILLQAITHPKSLDDKNKASAYAQSFNAENMGEKYLKYYQFISLSK